MSKKEMPRRCEETARHDAQSREGMPEVVRAYDSLVYAGQAIMRMMRVEDKATIGPLAKAHRAVVDARQALLPLVAEATKEAKLRPTPSATTITSSMTR